MEIKGSILKTVIGYVGDDDIATVYADDKGDCVYITTNKVKIELPYAAHPIVTVFY